MCQAEECERPNQMESEFCTYRTDRRCPLYSRSKCTQVPSVVRCRFEMSDTRDWHTKWLLKHKEQWSSRLCSSRTYRDHNSVRRCLWGSCIDKRTNQFPFRWGVMHNRHHFCREKSNRSHLDILLDDSLFQREREKPTHGARWTCETERTQAFDHRRSHLPTSTTVLTGAGRAHRS